MTDLRSPTPPLRQQPISRYRIIIPGDKPTTAAIEYSDDRASAVQHAVDTGGRVEVYVYGIGWEHIEKVAEV